MSVPILGRQSKVVECMNSRSEGLLSYRLSEPVWSDLVPSKGRSEWEGMFPSFS